MQYIKSDYTIVHNHILQSNKLSLVDKYALAVILSYTWSGHTANHKHLISSGITKKRARAAIKQLELNGYIHKVITKGTGAEKHKIKIIELHPSKKALHSPEYNPGYARISNSLLRQEIDLNIQHRALLLYYISCSEHYVATSGRVADLLGVHRTTVDRLNKTLLDSRYITTRQHNNYRVPVVNHQTLELIHTDYIKPKEEVTNMNNRDIEEVLEDMPDTCYEDYLEIYNKMTQEEYDRQLAEKEYYLDKYQEQCVQNGSHPVDKKCTTLDINQEVGVQNGIHEATQDGQRGVQNGQRGVQNGPLNNTTSKTKGGEAIAVNRLKDRNQTQVGELACDSCRPVSEIMKTVVGIPVPLVATPTQLDGSQDQSRSTAAAFLEINNLLNIDERDVEAVQMIESAVEAHGEEIVKKMASVAAKANRPVGYMRTLLRDDKDKIASKYGDNEQASNNPVANNPRLWLINNLKPNDYKTLWDKLNDEQRKYFYMQCKDIAVGLPNLAKIKDFKGYANIGWYEFVNLRVSADDTSLSDKLGADILEQCVLSNCMTNATAVRLRDIFENKPAEGTIVEAPMINHPQNQKTPTQPREEPQLATKEEPYKPNKAEKPQNNEVRTDTKQAILKSVGKMDKGELARVYAAYVDARAEIGCRDISKQDFVEQQRPRIGVSLYLMLNRAINDGFTSLEALGI